MKLGAMADLFEGLAQTLEPLLNKTETQDLRLVAGCLRQFADDTVASFCKYIADTRSGKPSKSRTSSRDETTEIAELAEKIRHYRANHKTYEYAAIESIVAQVAKLKQASIKQLGSGVGCYMSGTKPKMVSSLRDWLTNLKASADHANFTLSPAEVR